MRKGKKQLEPRDEQTRSIKEISMPSITGSGSIVAALLLAFSVVNQASAAPGDVLSTRKTNVNVRAEPSTDANILKRIEPGETVIEIDTKDGWHLVRLPGEGGEGWIFSPLLERVTNTTSPQGPRVSRSDDAVAAADQLASRLTTFDDGLVGSPTRGERVFYKCGSCHTTVEGIHAEGPSLVSVFGRSPAQASGYRYSGAMQAFARNGAVWDEATLDRFIQRPARVVKGTTMPFSGVRAPQDRRDLIAYLQQLSN